MFKKTIKPVFHLLIFTFIGCTSPHTEGRDEQAEKWIQSILTQRHKSYQVPIKEKFPDAVYICFQGSYIFQEDFEKLVGRKLPNFEYQGDANMVVWWILYSNGKTSWAKIPRSIANKSPNTKACINIEKTTISVQCEDRQKCIYKG